VEKREEDLLFPRTKKKKRVPFVPYRNSCPRLGGRSARKGKKKKKGPPSMKRNSQLERLVPGGKRGRADVRCPPAEKKSRRMRSRRRPAATEKKGVAHPLARKPIKLLPPKKKEENKTILKKRKILTSAADPRGK